MCFYAVKMSPTIIAIALAAFTLVVIVPRLRRSNRLDGNAARELVARGALLLDVRTADEYNDQHIDGAVNIPLNQLRNRIGEISPVERPVVVYCRSGMRSGHAKRLLETHSFTAVHDLGPMTAW